MQCSWGASAATFAVVDVSFRFYGFAEWPGLEVFRSWGLLGLRAKSDAKTRLCGSAASSAPLWDLLMRLITSGTAPHRRDMGLALLGVAGLGGCIHYINIHIYLYPSFSLPVACCLLPAHSSVASSSICSILRCCVPYDR